jgi:hypothetical protein
LIYLYSIYLESETCGNVDLQLDLQAPNQKPTI